MITNIVVRAKDIEVGHVVDNRNKANPLIVTRADGFTRFGLHSYKIEVSRNDEVVYEVELNEFNVLTYTYESEGAK